MRRFAKERLVRAFPNERQLAVDTRVAHDPERLDGVLLALAIGERADRKEAQLSTRSEEHTSELQSRSDLVCRLLLEKKKQMSDKTRCPAIDSTPEQKCRRRRSPIIYGRP